MSRPMITKVKGKDYLDAAAANKVFWDKFADNAVRIETDIHMFNDEVAVVRATISICNLDGQVIHTASGSKQAWRSEFANHLEKAETGAVRRAMAFLGVNVGSVDDEGSGGSQRFANAPSNTQTPQRAKQAPQRQEQAANKVDREQAEGIKSLLRAEKLSKGQVERLLSKFSGCSVVEDLTKGQASALENQLMEGTYSIPE